MSSLRKIHFTVDFRDADDEEIERVLDECTDAVAVILLNGCTIPPEDDHDDCPGYVWFGSSGPVCEHCGKDLRCFETHVPRWDGADECLSMFHVHDPANCEGRGCPIHHPSDHHMREWSLNWRNDRKLMERICPHGVGHPDPDDINPDHIHGCDGCCSDQQSRENTTYREGNA